MGQHPFQKTLNQALQNIDQPTQTGSSEVDSSPAPRITARSRVMDCPDWWANDSLPEQIARNWGKVEALFIRWLWKQERIPGFIFHGPVGRGKTGAAIGLAYRAALKGRFSQYVSCQKMLQDFGSARRFTSKETVPDCENRFSKPDVLVLDDLATRTLDAQESAFLFDLVDRRLNESKITIATTNSELELLDGRILDRFNGYDVDVSAWGPSLRGRT